MGARFSGRTEEQQYRSESDTTEQQESTTAQTMSTAPKLEKFADLADLRKRRSAAIANAIDDARVLELDWLTDLVLQFLLGAAPTGCLRSYDAPSRFSSQFVLQGRVFGSLWLPTRLQRTLRLTALPIGCSS